MLMSTQSRVIWVGLAVVVALATVGLLAPIAYAAPGTFIVNRTADTPDAILSDAVCDVNPAAPGDQCTLRAALEEANGNNNPTEQDRIDFKIPESLDPGVKTITPDSALPEIVEPVVIDGYSQPDSSVNSATRGTNARLRIELAGTNVEDRGLAIAASNTVVRGLVINRFRGTGISIASPGADLLSNVTIEGNFVGTNPAGTEKRRNSNGVLFSDTSESTIGGTSPASRNLISGNSGNGVVGYLGASKDNDIRGNLIGARSDGLGALGNGATGVLIYSPDAVGTRILSNSIYGNGGPGIDLGSDGVTPNDTRDPDPGPNRFQNFPVVSSASTFSGSTALTGTLNSRPLQNYTIQFFSSPSGDEGLTFIGSTTVSTDGSGNASFRFSPKRSVAAGQQVTATATRNSTGDTSEFSAPRAVAAS